MGFFKNFCNDDDKIIGLCSLKKRNAVSSGFKFEPKFNAVRLLYEPKINTNTFFV